MKGGPEDMINESSKLAVFLYVSELLKCFPTEVFIFTGITKP